MDLSILETFAELSIGLIGFAGVVSALGKSRLHVGVRSFRIRALLFYSALALFGSILPIVLGGFELELVTVLSFSTSAVILAFIGIFIWFVRIVRPLTAEGHLPIALVRGLGAIAVLVILLLFTGLLFYRSSLHSIYMVGLSWILAMGVFHFCMLVLSIQLQDEST